MNRFRWFLCTCVVLVTAVVAHAENFDVYPFTSIEEEARFERLTHELRCPKCQNQSIADSNAPIAQDLRQRTYELVREGHSDAEVVAYLKDRYGEFITYKPPFNVVTALLWTGPFLLLLLVVAGLLLRRRALMRVAGTGDKLSVDGRISSAADDEVRAILERYDDKPGGKPQ